MVWTCAEQRLWMYYTKDFECGAARQEGKGRPHRRFGDVVEDTRRMLRIG